jgi:hypothetical protein
MRYFTPKEVKSKPKVAKFINIEDFFIILFIFAFSTLLDRLVYRPLVIPYYIFSVVTGILLIMPSKQNPKRRNYQSLLLLVRHLQNNNFYPQELNISKKREGEEDEA